jgi:hypothetical protein
MSEPEKGMSCTLRNDAILVNGDLKISFRRTVRVPDTEQANYLPPNLGTFPLKAVSQHAQHLPSRMVAKGGVFFPMYRKYSEQTIADSNLKLTRIRIRGDVDQLQPYS